MFYELSDEFIVREDLPSVWKFFSNAENLPAITPAAMRFTVLTPRPIEIGQDSLLDYAIRVMGVPVRWRTRIIDWSPERQFIDLQIRGPYVLWHHQHTFAACEEGVICRDRVIYKLPGMAAGRLIHWAMVRRQLMEIFRFRRDAIGQRLGWVRGVQEDVEIRRLG